VTFPLPETAPCYFCEIVASVSTSWNVVERTDLTVTILNGRQFEIGQCMVLPVRHAPTLLDLTQPEEAAVMSAAKRVTRAMVAAYAPDGVLLYQNNGVGSGQEVPHYHLHVVPRRPNSDWGFGPPHLARLQKEDRPVHLDHAVATDSKVQTVATLRRFFDDIKSRGTSALASHAPPEHA
jgi:histidine triad (HIT) family protein